MTMSALSRNIYRAVDLQMTGTVFDEDCTRARQVEVRLSAFRELDASMFWHAGIWDAVAEGEGRHLPKPFGPNHRPVESSSFLLVAVDA